MPDTQITERYLSPYDTGKRYEPNPWALPPSRADLEEMPPMALALEEARFGKVDFDDENGDTGFTVWVERNERGIPVVHVQQTGVDPVAIEIHRGE